MLFDGHCPLCLGSVRLLLALDRRRLLRFAPLDGPTARRLLSAEGPGGAVDSLRVALPGGAGGPRALARSTALLAALAATGGPGRALATVGRLAPRRWLDRLYDFVARHRTACTGRRANCPVPPPGRAGQFLP